MPAGPRFLAAFGLLLFVSACAVGGIRTGVPINDDARIQSTATYVAATGQFPTVIRGNPSDLGDRDFERAVIDALRLPAPFPPTAFAVSPDPPVSHPFRLVLVFNPADRGLGPRRLCSLEADIPVTGPADGLFLRAAYCQGSDPISENFGAAEIADYRSAKFRTLMFLVMADLFPPHRADSDNCLPIGLC